MPLSDEQEAIVAKLLDDIDRIPPLKDAGSRVIPPAPLSINERRIVAETLRRAWLTPKEWRAYKHQRDLDQYEAVKNIARHGVPYGERGSFVQGLYGKSREALAQFIRRKRHP